MTEKEKIRAYVKRLQKPEGHGDYWKGYDSALNDILSFIDSLQEEPVNKDLEEAIDTYLKSYWGSEKEKQEWPFLKKMAIYFTKWQKANLWKPADGNDLPEYDREVVVFTQNFPNDAGIMSVAIGHRPNPDGWNGKSLLTGKVEHYTPKTYGKGGWNIPDVKYWLDCSMPKEIEL